MAVDLDTFRKYVGATAVTDDQMLQRALNIAAAHIHGRIKAEHVDKPEIDEATLLLANRLWKRRGSPEGTAGFGGDGVVIRILNSDPDIRALMERSIDYGSDDTSTALGVG